LATQQCAARDALILAQDAHTGVEEAWRLLFIVHRFPDRSYWLRLTIAFAFALMHSRCYTTTHPGLSVLRRRLLFSFDITRSRCPDVDIPFDGHLLVRGLRATIHLSLFYKPIRLRRLYQPWPEIEMLRRISSGLLQRVLLY
jgi:hypothetical protein